MELEHLYAFYEYALLPQFGLESKGIGWQKSIETGPDETAHYFSTPTHDFILIFEDYDGLGRNSGYIKEELGLTPDDYVFVTPKAHTPSMPTLRFTLQTPYKYAPNITGSFTLLMLREQAAKDSKELFYTHVKNPNGRVWAPH